MAPYQAILAYDGTDFYGFQRQKERRTVQAAIETALTLLGWQGKSILASGRTDAGVHALGQVIAFSLEWSHSEDQLRSALNAHLPADVSVRMVSEVPEGFHPRFDAQWRSYVYRILCDEVRHPVKERYMWRVWPLPDPSLLELAAAYLVGTHDFEAFGRPYRHGGSTIRRVKRAEWKAISDGLQFTIEANAFLYHMVRRLVYAQIKVGQKNANLEEFVRALRAEEGGVIQGIAPPQGLLLTQVDFG